MAKRSVRPIITAEYADLDTPFAVAYQRGGGYVVVERDTLALRAEFEGGGAGHEAARELANELNLEHAAEVADSAAALAELSRQADAEDAERFAREDAAYGAYLEAHGHDPRDWPSYVIAYNAGSRMFDCIDVASGAMLGSAYSYQEADEGVFVSRAAA